MMNLSPEQCEIIFSKRKSYAVEVKDGKVILRLPYYSGMRKAHELLQKHHNWIKQKILEQNIKKAENPPVTIESGKYFPLFDALYVIKEGTKLEFNNAFYITPGGDAADKLRQLYRQTAKSILGLKLAEKAKQCDIVYSGMKISNARTRWGSCSYKKSINLNWRLLLLPERLADYIIAHELAHIREMNHSRAFYMELERISPEWRRAERELRQYSLNLDNWE